MKKIFILLVGILMLATACQTTTDDSNTNKRYYGGSDGLDVTFVEGEPPDQVLDGSQDIFDITLLVDNIGEEDISPGEVIVTLNGIERDVFQLNSLTEKNENEIRGVHRIGDRKENGDQDEVRFKSARYNDVLPFDFEISMRADICYEYGTEAVADVCLKKDASARRTEDKCEISNDNVEIENSGSPMRIANFVQSARGSNKIQFIFDVESIGGGDYFPTGNFVDSCTTDERNDDTVNIAVDFIRSDVSVDCTPFGGSNGEIRLVSGKRTVRCTVDTSNMQEIAFERPMRIKLDYMYKTSKDKTFIVESTQDF
ncbi:MAG: hypothetical protein AABW49_01140 [Nanoarchaeota archaeon]